MDHNDIRHMLSEYIDGAVSPEDRAAIEAHLGTCEKCSEALRELRQTVAHLKAVEEIDPPAWMTQKIMAKVRAEAEKKSWFQRLFFPLPVKLPLEAIGVLFIAVTALFIYQNMHPSLKAAKPQFQDQAAAPAPVFSKPAEQPASVPSEKKRAYSAESDQALLNKGESTSREMLQERTATSSGAAPEQTMEAKVAAPAAPIAGATADKAIPAIKLLVMDREAAAKEVERAIAQVNGSIVRKESTGSKTAFLVTIKARRANELRNKLKLLGEIEEQPGELEAQKEQVELRIEILRKSAKH